MEEKDKFILLEISNDPKEATKMIVDILFNSIYPAMLNIRNQLQNYKGALIQGDISKIQDAYALYASQIMKCLQTIFDVFKIEHHDCVVLQESRQCTLERLTWCVNRLHTIEQKLDNSSKEVNEEECDDSILVTPMYFVNWIDHTFDILSKLADVIYKTDYKVNDVLYKQWKNYVLEGLSNLHVCLDELLLSAMTLCKYCLSSDQHIVKARCQVVLRESKALLSELVEGVFDSGAKVTPDSLKLPIMPSNVNVLIDVLKDVLYVLETNTNTALLALVVHCFSHSMSPVDILKQHFTNAKGMCPCHVKSEDEVTADCSFVKEFDLYNERLLQIGSFAVSCSSDQSRILSLRSGLASLEALDPHLVPALMLSPDSHHAQLLVDSWRQEVQDIRDNIFLIVDPAAFAEKTKQMMHQILLELMKESRYNNSLVCSVVNIGCVVLDFFSVYNRLEPDALTPHEKLASLLADLDKVQMECKIVSNLLSSGDDFVYDVNTSSNKKISLDQLIKRLKLLYTLVSRINSLLHPKENEELFDCDVEEEALPKNMTRTIHLKNLLTYVQSPRKPENMSRSIFARTSNIRWSTAKFPLLKLTKHLKAKQRDDLSFSVQLDELFNLSEAKLNNRAEHVFTNKQLDSVREPSVLYNFSPKKRSSLRKAILNRHCKVPFDKEVPRKSKEIDDNSSRSERGSLLDEATNLQITDILNQMSDITSTFAKKPAKANATFTRPCRDKAESEVNSNILRINVNSKGSISKHIWNIPVNASTAEMPLDDSRETEASNITVPSNVTTLERINDIDLVESKLNSLKNLEETSL